MPRKDPEKNKEWQKQYHKRIEYHRQYHRDNKERRNKIRDEYYRKKHPNCKPQDSYHDFETHRELAMSSGIRTQMEWRECCKIGLMPNGIHSRPDRVFMRK